MPRRGNKYKYIIQTRKHKLRKKIIQTHSQTKKNSFYNIYVCIFSITATYSAPKLFALILLKKMAKKMMNSISLESLLGSINSVSSQGFSFLSKINTVHEPEGFYLYDVIVEVDKRGWRYSGQFITDFKTFCRKNKKGLSGLSDKGKKTLFTVLYTGNKCTINSFVLKTFVDVFTREGIPIFFMGYVVNKARCVVFDMKTPSAVLTRYTDGYWESYPKPRTTERYLMKDGTYGCYDPVLGRGDMFQHVCVELTLKKPGQSERKVMVDLTYQFVLPCEKQIPCLKYGLPNGKTSEMPARIVMGGPEAYQTFMCEREAFAKFRQYDDEDPHLETVYSHLSKQKVQTHAKEVVKLARSMRLKKVLAMSCSNCGREWPSMPKCCDSAFYCDRKCQIKHRKVHKKECCGKTQNGRKKVQ
jgi:hypothetical protein